MSFYIYRAVNKKGRESKGSASAVDKGEVVRDIKAKGFHPVEIREVDEKEFYKHRIEAKDPKSIRLFERKRIPTKTLVLLLRDLASMIGAGIIIPRALLILSDQEHKGKVKDLMESMWEIVNQGKPLSEALKKYPGAFPPLVAEMVEVGEQSGRLEEILNRLAVFYEKQEEIESRFKQAMIYPCIILFVATGAILAFLTIALPKFVGLFEDVGSDLPAITKFLIGLSNFLTTHWLYLVLAVGLAVMIFGYGMRFVTVRRYVHALYLKFPLFGPLYGKVVLSRVLRSIAAMYKSGIAILVIFRTVPLIARNIIFEGAIRRIETRLKKGENLADAFAEEPTFPAMVSNILHVGAESGTLDKGLDRLASRFEAEVDRITQTLGTIIEPFFIVVMGGVVLFIALALFMPLVKIVTVLS